MTVRDVVCGGACRHRSAEECAGTTQLVFPYRGVYVRHLGRSDAIAEANQVLFFNAAEGYRVSHPAAGGDSSLSLTLGTALLREIAPPEHVRPAGDLAFRRQRLRIDPDTQALVAQLRHTLTRGLAEPLQAESLVLSLARRALGERHARARASTQSQQRLVDRAKLSIASHPARRWTLGEVAAAVGVSPVYLTQVFQRVEGIPLYRYHLRLRLARALDLLGEYDDLARLGMDLGFSSHSHFSSAFRQLYGRTPAEFRRSLRLH
jgi:AraC-like DNA-binding protein